MNKFSFCRKNDLLDESFDQLVTSSDNQQTREHAKKCDLEIGDMQPWTFTQSELKKKYTTRIEAYDCIPRPENKPAEVTTQNKSEMNSSRRLYFGSPRNGQSERVQQSERKASVSKLQQNLLIPKGNISGFGSGFVIPGHLRNQRGEKWIGQESAYLVRREYPLINFGSGSVRSATRSLKKLSQSTNLHEKQSLFDASEYFATGMSPEIKKRLGDIPRKETQESRRLLKLVNCFPGNSYETRATSPGSSASAGRNKEGNKLQKCEDLSKDQSPIHDAKPAPQLVQPEENASNFSFRIRKQDNFKKKAPTLAITEQPLLLGGSQFLRAAGTKQAAGSPYVRHKKVLRKKLEAITSSTSAGGPHGGHSQGFDIASHF